MRQPFGIESGQQQRKHYWKAEACVECLRRLQARFLHDARTSREKSRGIVRQAAQDKVPVAQQERRKSCAQGVGWHAGAGVSMAMNRWGQSCERARVRRATSARRHIWHGRQSLREHECCRGLPIYREGGVERRSLR